MVATEQKNLYTTDKLMVAVDCIIFGFDQQSLKLLLFKRKVEPLRGQWSLVGSFMKQDETVADAAERILEESTGLSEVFMEELGCFSKVDRDPGGRVISMAYFALLRLGVKEIQTVENMHARWFNLNEVPPLILDHNEMVEKAVNKLKKKARYQPIGFELLPKKFTIPQLWHLYKIIFQKKFDRRNFRKKILSMGILEKLDEKDKSGSKKGAFLYQFDVKEYRALVAKGFNFEL